MNKAVDKYLRLYAEHEIHALETFPQIEVDQLLVVPCYCETHEFAARLADTLLTRHRVLVIVVINQPPGPPDPVNQKLHSYFLDQTIIWRSDRLSLHSATNGRSYWLVVDRFTDGCAIDRQQGVGLARKIGCDLSVALRNRKICRSPWIYTSDADAHLPDNYFQSLNLIRPYSAVVFTVRHIPVSHANDKVFAATQLYEQALDYYVRGLAWAGSPYAFHSLGSAMAVLADGYCQARGFPRRSGGEDFYLLNKLAKLGGVHHAFDICVQVEARQSGRVPFGTGPAVNKIMALETRAEFPYFAPEVFAALKLWLDQVPKVWNCLQQQRDPLADLPGSVAAALIEAGIKNLWPHLIQQTPTPQKTEQAIHQWFDAFQTLKFVRRLQRSCFPDKPLLESLKEAEFMRNCI